MNKCGPRIDPCGTSHLICLVFSVIDYELGPMRLIDSKPIMNIAIILSIDVSQFFL